jgi:hypothetical protein
MEHRLQTGEEEQSRLAGDLRKIGNTTHEDVLLAIRFDLSYLSRSLRIIADMETNIGVLNRSGA